MSNDIQKNWRMLIVIVIVLGVVTAVGVILIASKYSETMMEFWAAIMISIMVYAATLYATKKSVGDLWNRIDKKIDEKTEEMSKSVDKEKELNRRIDGLYDKIDDVLSKIDRNEELNRRIDELSKKVDSLLDNKLKRRRK